MRNRKYVTGHALLSNARPKSPAAFRGGTTPCSDGFPTSTRRSVSSPHQCAVPLGAASKPETGSHSRARVRGIHAICARREHTADHAPKAGPISLEALARASVPQEPCSVRSRHSSRQCSRQHRRPDDAAMSAETFVCNSVIVARRGIGRSFNAREPRKRQMVFVSHANPEETSLRSGFPCTAGERRLCRLVRPDKTPRRGEVLGRYPRGYQPRTVSSFIFCRGRRTRNAVPLTNWTAPSAPRSVTNCRDFIITAKTDDLPMMRSIWRSPAEPYRLYGPLGQGTLALLEKLRERRRSPDPGLRSQTLFVLGGVASSALTPGSWNRPEQVLSNWFKVENVPSVLYEHKLSAIKPGPVGIDETALPVRLFG